MEAGHPAARAAPARPMERATPPSATDERHTTRAGHDPQESPATAVTTTQLVVAGALTVLALLGAVLVAVAGWNLTLNTPTWVGSSCRRVW